MIIVIADAVVRREMVYITHQKKKQKQKRRHGIYSRDYASREKKSARVLSAIQTDREREGKKGRKRHEEKTNV